MTGVLACVLMVTTCLIRYSGHSRIHNIHYALDATCISVETTLTCTGDGTLTQAVVRAAGAYSMFTKAIIKNDISVLGGSAFLLCSSLSEIELPTTLVEMQGGAFDCCPIINLSIPTSVTTISSATVNNCQTFRNFMVNGNLNGELTNHVVKDGFLLSKDSKKLIASPTGKMHSETLKLPSDIEIVGDACRWSRASRIEVPDTVLTIEASAFYRAFMVTLKLGKSVSSFAASALEACNSLTSIEMGQNTNFFMSNNVFGKGSASSPSDILKVFEPASKIENTNPMMSSLATGALQLCPTLKSITFAAVASGKTAVYKSLLTNQVVARIITSGGQSEWSIVACVGGATSIDLGLLSATEQNTYKWIYTAAFRGCKLLTELKLHSKVTKVGGSFARECSSLAKIGFAGCYCGDADKPGTNGANVIPGLSFQGCILTNILTWPSGSFSIGREVFGSSRFTAIGFPSGLTSIGNDAFVGAPVVTRLVFNDNLQKICTGAFRSCPLLTTIEFGSASQLKYVESMAFAYCTALTTITFPDTATTPVDINPNCFAYSSSLTSIKFKSNTGPYRSDGIACYKRDSSTNNAYHTLVICPPGLQEFEFDKQTYTIGTHAFYGCSKLISVKMSNIVETIEDSAFYECHAIEFVRLTPSIRIIGKSAFDSCKHLKHILYCSNNPQVTYTWDPFPTNPNIYLWHDYPKDNFCGHSCFAILDRSCNIPTQYFTEVVASYAPTVLIQQFIGITTATILCPDLW